MARNRPPAALGGSPDDVEAQFYEALQKGDLEAMMAAWADDDDIVCVHPGGTRVVGAAAIRASFEAIFGNGTIPVRIEQVRRLQWLGGALHHLVERIEVPGGQAGKTQPSLPTKGTKRTSASSSVINSVSDSLMTRISF